MNKKFLQTLDTDVYKTLSIVAKSRGIPIQELVRAVVVPDWMHLVSKQTPRRARLSSLSRARPQEN